MNIQHWREGEHEQYHADAGRAPVKLVIRNLFKFSAMGPFALCDSSAGISVSIRFSGIANNLSR